MNCAPAPRPPGRPALALGLLCAFAFAGCGDPEVGGTGKKFKMESGDLAWHLVVSGTDYQMGWHHGRLLRDEIRELVPATLDELFRKDRTPEDAKYLETACRIYASKMKPLVPESVREELRGLAEASGVSQDDLFLLEAARDGLTMHPGEARPIGAAVVPEESEPHAVRWSRGIPARPFPSVGGWLVLERRPVGRNATLVWTWPGGLGCVAGTSKSGLLAAHCEMDLGVEHLSLNGPPFSIGFRVALERVANAQAFLDALPRTTAHRVAVVDASGASRSARIARVEPEPSPEPTVRPNFSVAVFKEGLKVVTDPNVYRPGKTRAYDWSVP